MILTGLIIMGILLCINYSYYITSLCKTYNYHTAGGNNVYHSDIYFTTRKELLTHAIPFYYAYLLIVKLINIYNNSLN